MGENEAMASAIEESMKHGNWLNSLLATVAITDELKIVDKDLKQSLNAEFELFQQYFEDKILNISIYFKQSFERWKGSLQSCNRSKSFLCGNKCHAKYCEEWWREKTLIAYW